MLHFRLGFPVYTTSVVDGSDCYTYMYNAVHVLPPIFGNAGKHALHVIKGQMLYWGEITEHVHGNFKAVCSALEW